MANEITALVRSNLGRDFVSIHGAVSEDGQGMIFLKKDAIPKGVNGHSYATAMIKTKAIARLAKAAGKTYGVGAIIVTHANRMQAIRITKKNCASCGRITTPMFGASPDRNRKSR
jgi:hypothetical protein